MKVLLIKDVYKLGHAGDVKRVADGYGRNFLLPQGLAVLATTGAVKASEGIRKQATAQRALLNNEMSAVSERIKNVVLAFPSKAGETGKLYGSITPQMIVDALNKKAGTEIDRRQIEVQPIRALGTHKALIRLTVDLIPEIKVVVYREGEMPASLAAEVAPAAPAEAAEETAA
jgi:large subunit ribosomal protein L9